MKLSIKAGSTSQSINVFVRDSTSTTGGGLAGIAPAGGSLLSGTKLDYSFTGTNAARVNVSLTVLAAVNSAYSSGGIVQIDNTNMIGWIRIDIPDAALATAKGRCVSFLLWGGTNMAPTPFEIELTGWDNQDAVRGGMTALPNAAAAAAGGLPILGTNAASISFTAGFTISNASGSALTLSSSGGNGSGLDSTGNGSGSGGLFRGGLTGRGTVHIGGATSGPGILGTSTSGAGIQGNGGTNGDGIVGTGAGTGGGLKGIGGSTGPGIAGTGGATSGDGLILTATVGHGINSTGNGASKHGALFAGSSTSGTCDGISFVAGSGGVGLRSGSVTVTGATILTGAVSMAAGLAITQSTLNASAVVITGNGSGSGVLISGGLTGDGLVSQGGATSGSGAIFSSQGSSGSGFSCISLNGDAVSLLGLGGGSTGITVTGGVVIDTLDITSTTTLSGAVTATNAGNDIRGVQLTVTPPTAAAIATAVWASATRTLTAFAFTPSVNVAQVNGVTVNGAGTSISPWGP